MLKTFQGSRFNGATSSVGKSPQVVIEDEDSENEDDGDNGVDKEYEEETENNNSPFYADDMPEEFFGGSDDENENPNQDERENKNQNDTADAKHEKIQLHCGSDSEDDSECIVITYQNIKTKEVYFTLEVTPPLSDDRAMGLLKGLEEAQAKKAKRNPRMFHLQKMVIIWNHAVTCFVNELPASFAAFASSSSSSSHSSSLASPSQMPFMSPLAQAIISGTPPSIVEGSISNQPQHGKFPPAIPSSSSSSTGAKGVKGEDMRWRDIFKMVGSKIMAKKNTKKDAKKSTKKDMPEHAKRTTKTNLNLNAPQSKNSNQEKGKARSR